MISRNNEDLIVITLQAFGLQIGKKKRLHGGAEKWTRSKFIAGLWKSDNGSKADERRKKTLQTKGQKWKQEAVTNDYTTTKVMNLGSDSERCQSKLLQWTPSAQRQAHIW